MRIIAGKLKGSTLNEIKNKDTRPLRDMARENLFNLLIFHLPSPIDFKQPTIDRTWCCRNDLDEKTIIILSPFFIREVFPIVFIGDFALQDDDLKALKL